MLSCLITTNSVAGLMAYYPFNGNAVDETGNGYDGQLVNVSLTVDRFGNPRQAYRFDGNGYIKIMGNFEELAQGITLSLWVYPSQPKTALLLHTAGIGLLTNEDNSFWFFSVKATEAVELNKWQHLVTTIDTFGNVDLYKNGVYLRSGSSDFVMPTEDQMTLGGAFVGILDEVRIYNHVLSEAQVMKLYNEEKPTQTEIAQKKSEGTYEEGYREGRLACISNPESCGLRYPADNEQAHGEMRDEANPSVKESACDNETTDTVNKTSPVSSSSKVIVSIPLAAIEDNRTTVTELVRDIDTLTGDVIFRLKVTPTTAAAIELPLIWQVEVNPINVQAGEAQLVSWQSRQQAWYYFYLYNLNNQPVNTQAFLTETCQATGSNGNDGCLGWQNSPKRRSDSWTVPAQLTSGTYKIKVVIGDMASKPVVAEYSPTFLVR
jgi:hypothetical protein